ncbi:endonuclease [Flavobacterium wongokense]|uniref:endonuclease n=1 Tax=Flavobacterium wongokense TaxID=2910674 RepID=UPI001F1D050C|nr:endonuclease [Flavobacterium sp. WG47]MCF6131858.1 endonuclease [Flavobacterium sp. WG47]
MKKILTLLFLSFTVIGIAQDKSAVTLSTNSIPPGYYNTATGTGYTLKTQLFNIIKDHNDRGYAGLWTTYETSDRDHQYENDDTLIDLYSENPTGADPYNFVINTNQCGSYSAEGGCYNREHVIPQSYFGNGVQPMYSDAHSVLPTDGKVNGWRDDHPYGVVAATTNPCNAGATNTPCATQNGSKLGNNVNSGYSAGYSSKVFEPLDAFKGDIARVIFYFATRYEDQLVGFFTTTSSEAKVIFDGTSGHTFSQTFLNILLTWNTQDPVSAREIERNDAIYARQGNRNPFIDHPEWATTIWGLPLAVSDFDSLATVSIYPNPSRDVVNISTGIALDQIDIITINGQVLQQIKNPTFENNNYTISNLPKGFYFVKLSSATNSVTKKVLIN